MAIPLTDLRVVWGINEEVERQQLQARVQRNLVRSLVSSLAKFFRESLEIRLIQKGQKFPRDVAVRTG